LCAQLRLIGEFDGSTAPCVLVVATAFLGEFPGNPILDLGGITFADSALRRAIVGIGKYMDADLTRLRLVNQSAAITRLFLAGGVIGMLSSARLSATAVAELQCT
jgi:anti-anti-sigma factor